MPKKAGNDNGVIARLRELERKLKRVSDRDVLGGTAAISILPPMTKAQRGFVLYGVNLTVAYVVNMIEEQFPEVRER